MSPGGLGYGTAVGGSSGGTGVGGSSVGGSGCGSSVGGGGSVAGGGCVGGGLGQGRLQPIQGLAEVFLLLLADLLDLFVRVAGLLPAFVIG